MTNTSFLSVLTLTSRNKYNLNAVTIITHYLYLSCYVWLNLQQAVWTNTQALTDFWKDNSYAKNTTRRELILYDPSYLAFVLKSILTNKVRRRPGSDSLSSPKRDRMYTFTGWFETNRNLAHLRKWREFFQFSLLSYFDFFKFPVNWNLPTSKKRFDFYRDFTIQITFFPKKITKMSIKTAWNILRSVDRSYHIVSKPRILI